MTQTRNDLIGACGLYCGLCTKYQSKAPSRCIGCKLGEIFNCAIFLRRKVVEWIPAADNLRQIKEVCLENWLKEQKERQALAEELLQNYNEGRSMSFYCEVCTRMPINLINEAMKEAKKKIVIEKIDKSDLKAKAKILKSLIKNMAVKSNINMN